MVRTPEDASDEARSLVTVLKRYARESPAAELFSFLPDGEEAGAAHLTRGELDQRARELAARLQSRALAGERALLVYPPGLEFIIGFFGCLYAGVTAVPAYPPRPNRPMTRLVTIVDDARPAVVLTSAALRADSARWTAGIPALAGVQVICSDELDGTAAAECWVEPTLTADTLAFLQYTSGSTAAPKGVMITHGNLMANSARIHAVFGSVAGERGVFWLPLFHDMGLIGGVIQTLYCGGASTLMPPASFLQRPIRWLEAISRTRALISGGPNFAYDLCVEKTTPEQRAALDLSHWRVAFNGAEPIRAETLERFADAFAPAGFRREAFLPCYGLAEATLLVSGNATGRAPSVVSVDSAALGRGEIIEPAGVSSMRLVGCGQPAEGHVVAIVDPTNGERCPDGRIGEIWFAGPSVARGYWGRPDESRDAMAARLAGDESRAFLRTGDLGFLGGGELFVTGRIKDLIIVRGRNIYPQDVEWAAERAHAALRIGGAAAFAIDRDGEEHLAVVVESERRLAPGVADEAFAAIRRAVAESLDADVAAIRLIKPTTLPRTSSGKVQRRACRDALLAGTLETVAEWTRPAAAPPPPPSAPTAPSPPRPAEIGPSRSRSEIVDWVTTRIATSAGVRPDEVDIRAPLAGFGVGSLQAVRLAAELEEWLGRKLPATLAYDYPTIDAMAAFLAGEPVGATPVRPAAAISGHEPIAIVGIACRFPGASGPGPFWDLLRDGAEAIGEVPDARWTEDDLRGHDFPRRGGYLRGIDLFDAPFFGITRREAIFLDPQQRMLMELAWEALEDAGAAPERLAGTPVGVFIGIATNDYAFIQVKRGGAATSHRVTGNSGSIAANRISHFFDLRGPSLAIDTACSSSLVATHLACRSLRDGESEIALAGGSNLLLQAQVFAGFARSGFLSPDGHCRAFDSEANGYVRGEGAGIVVLKPLSRALADGDDIYAIIRGGAVNQDGRTNGLTAPSGPAQEAVLRAAYRHAGLSPGQIDYVEAHGTGTPLGDPIELAALGAVLADGRAPGRRCVLGSLKTNLGHLEAAAGIAGLIKTALALHHRAIPASLHYSRPNPHADLERLPLKVAARFERWPDSGEPARAGVSAFGFGGTNAHLVLEEAPRQPHAAIARPAGGGRDADVVIPLSARTPEALAELARSFRDFLRGAPDDLDLRDVAYSAGARRGHLEHRLALVVAGRDEAIAALDAVVRGGPHVCAMTGRRLPGLRRAPVFVFSDGHAIGPAAARELLDLQPAFRAAIELCDAGSGRVLAVATPDHESRQPGTTDGETSALFAVLVALARLWESWGLAPAGCIGDGIGEVAAAYVSGRITLEAATKLIPLTTVQSGEPSRQFRDDVAKLAAAGHDVFLEIGFRPGMDAAIRNSVAPGQASPLVLSSPGAGDRGRESLRWSAAALYAAGFDLEWSRVSPPGRFVRLPTYPWRRGRYWLDEEAPPQAIAARVSIRATDVPSPHPPVNGRAHEPIASPGASISGPERPDDLLEALRTGVAALLGVTPDRVDPDRSLIAMGLDSIAAMELKADIDAYLGANFPLEVLIDASSLREVAERVGAFIGRANGKASHHDDPPAPPAARPSPGPAGGFDLAPSLPGDPSAWDISISDVEQLDEAELDMLIERLQ